MSIEFEAAEALRHIALDETVKSYVLQHPPIYQVLHHAAMLTSCTNTCLLLVALGKRVRGRQILIILGAFLPPFQTPSEFPIPSEVCLTIQNRRV